jgi:DNA-directed RNA polymerase alpha subunit
VQVNPIAICLGKIELAISCEQPMKHLAQAALDEFFTSKPKQLPFDAPIAELGLSNQTTNILDKHHGIRTVGALKSCTKAELLELRYFGETMLVEVIEKLRKVGMKLRKA